MKYSEHLGWFQRKAGTHKINAPHHKNISNSLPSHLCQLVLFRPPTSLYHGRQRLSMALAAEVGTGLDQEFWLESGLLCGLPESADVVRIVASQNTNPSHIKHSLYYYVFFHILLPLVKHASHNCHLPRHQVSGHSRHCQCQSANKSIQQTQILWWASFPPNGPWGPGAFKTAHASAKLETLIKGVYLSGPVRRVDVWPAVPSALWRGQEKHLLFFVKTFTKYKNLGWVSEYLCFSLSIQLGLSLWLC